MAELQEQDQDRTIIEQFEQFYQLNYQDEILQKGGSDEAALLVDFPELSMFDLSMAENLLEDPDETIEAANLALETFDTTDTLNPRFRNLPSSSHLPIRETRSRHLNKFHQFQGIIKQKNDVKPQLVAATFECPRCQTHQVIQQNEKKLKKPRKCGDCGWKGSFNLVEKDLQDVQKMVLEEAPEELTGGEQPKRINCFLKDDLVSPMTEKKTNPGSKVTVVGTLKEVPVNLSTGAKSTNYDLQIQGNYVEPMQEEFSDLEIDASERDEIISASNDPRIFEKLVESVAPGIYGHDKIKQALTLQLFGGVRKSRGEGVKQRGDIHVLLVGDPGAGKCVTGDTKTMLNDGTITTMRDYAEQHRFNGDHTEISETLTTISKTGEASSGTATKVWKRDAPDTLLQVKTASGRELTVTPNHPLFTTNNGVIFAKEAQEYTEGDRVAIPRRQRVNGSLQSLTTTEGKHYNNSKEYTHPSILTPRLARLLGYLTGDGYLAENQSSAWISFTNKNPDVLDDYQKTFTALFDQPLTTRTEDNHTEAYVTSQGLYNYLQDNFPELTQPSTAKTVPTNIQRSKDDVVKAYLKAYFDTDGYVNEDKRHVSATTTSEELADHISHLLQRFGIVPRRKTKEKHATNTEEQRSVTAHQLIIPPCFTKQFEQRIGFTHTEKQRALERITQKPRNTNVDTVPGVENLLKHIRFNQERSQHDMGIPRSTYAHYEQGNREPSRNTLQTIVDRIDTTNTWSYQALEQIAHSDIFWDEIERIETIESNDDYVYDFQVDRTHNYVANGVVAHNSQLLKRISHVAPKSRFVSGKGSTGAGLTASVVKDEFLKGWALEAGALVLANKGIACIDELDKMEEEDASAMHEALEQQSITISKANIQATLKAQTTVLAAANPKYGRFDPYDVIAKQIDMPSTLINRFDLIFPIRDIPDQEKDKELSSFILDLHRDDQDEEPPYSTNFMKRYIAFARQRVAPTLTDGALEEIQDYFVSMRNQAGKEERIQSVPISARQLEGLVRLATASAKTRLSTTVDREDAERAVELLHYCLTQIGYDEETGKFDIDKIETGTTASERSQISVIKELISSLEEANGGSVPLEDLYQEAEAREIDEHDAEEIIEKLKRKGDIYEPTSGYISRIQ